MKNLVLIILTIFSSQLFSQNVVDTVAFNQQLIFTLPDILQNSPHPNENILSVNEKTFGGGEITNLGGSDYIYTPPENYSGLDYFSYKAINAKGIEVEHFAAFKIGTFDVIIFPYCFFEPNGSMNSIKHQIQFLMKNGSNQYLIIHQESNTVIQNGLPINNNNFWAFFDTDKKGIHSFIITDVVTGEYIILKILLKNYCGACSL